MATLADSAAELGVTPDSEDGLDPELMKPVRLSPTTRRQVNVMDRRQLEVDTFSDAAQMEDMIIAKREAEDKAADEAWSRDMDRRTKAVAWNTKVVAQQHGAAALEELAAVSPTDPDYQVKKAAVIAKYPMSTLDTRVAGILDANDKAFLTVEANRDEARKRQQALEDNAATMAANQQFRVADREDRQKESQLAREQTFEDRVEMAVASWSPEASDKFTELTSQGVPVRDAYRQAAKVERDGLTSRQITGIKAAADIAGNQKKELEKVVNDPLADTAAKETAKQQLLSINQKLAEYEAVLAADAPAKPSANSKDAPKVGVIPVKNLIPTTK